MHDTSSDCGAAIPPQSPSGSSGLECTLVSAESPHTDAAETETTATLSPVVTTRSPVVTKPRSPLDKAVKALEDNIAAACGPGGSIAAAVASALERSLRPAIASTEFQEDLAYAFQQAFARAANADRAAAGELHLPLMPLPLYDGTYPAWFPETIAELDTMSGAQLEAIMMEYDLPVPPAFADRRAAFRAFWGLPPS